MKKKLKHWIEEWIIDLVLSRVRVGGHCGCCGAYIPNEIFDNTWAWGLCTKHFLKNISPPGWIREMNDE